MESLASIARELHALPPAEFIAARNARAKEAADDGDRALATRIRALAKPSVAAWAVYALVRHRFDDVDAVLDLGEGMRAAQDAFDRDSLRELGHDRQRMLGGIGRPARELGEELGVPVSEAAAVEVQQTLQAAMGDPAAAAAVRDGTLVRTFSGSGLDPVDLASAVALPEALPAPGATPEPETAAGGAARTPVGGAADRKHTAQSGPGDAPAPPPAPRPDRGDELAARREARREAKRRAEQEAEDAQHDAELAEAELAALDLRIRDTADERRDAAEELRDLKRRVEELQDALTEADRRAAALRKERVVAQRASDAAARAATRARQRFEKLP